MTPRCPRHGAKHMKKRPTDIQTAEQRACGTWVDCKAVDCHYSYLIPSGELTRDLAMQASRLNRPASTVTRKVAKK